MPSSNVPPVFCKNRDLCGRGESLDPLEVCDSVAEAISNPQQVEGAQQVRHLWKIYLRSQEARIALITRGLYHNGRQVIVYEENPDLKPNTKSSDKLEKILIKDLPFDVSNSDVISFFRDLDVDVRSDVKYVQLRRPDGEPTKYLNGDRFIFAKSPIFPVLPHVVNISGNRCRILHQSQRDVCRSCRNFGHAYGDLECPAYISDETHTNFAFRSYKMKMSNMYMTHIQYDETIWFGSVEHGFQWFKAMALDRPDVAEDILNTWHAGQAKAVADRKLPHDEAEKWSHSKEALQVMAKLVYIKAKEDYGFLSALQQTDGIIAEATGDTYWASGIANLEICAHTKPEHFPGKNILGAILMDIRGQTRDYWLSVKNSEDNSSDYDEYDYGCSMDGYDESSIHGFDSHTQTASDSGHQNAEVVDKQSFPTLNEANQSMSNKTKQQQKEHIQQLSEAATQSSQHKAKLSADKLPNARLTRKSQVKQKQPGLQTKLDQIWKTASAPNSPSKRKYTSPTEQREYKQYKTNTGLRSTVHGNQASVT